MDSVQHQSSSHHFLVNMPINDQNKSTERSTHLSTKPVRIPPITTAMPTTTKPSWQRARDISMDILSRKATKISLKENVSTSNLTHTDRSLTRKYSINESANIRNSSDSPRIPRMPTDKQTAAVAIAYELSCSCCQGPCIEKYFRCRVCVKVYHSRCLYQRNYIKNESFPLPRMGKQDWSCPECRDLTRLIEQNELNYLIEAFDHIDQNSDGFIILEEFLSFKPNKSRAHGFELFVQHNRDIGKTYFRLMDVEQEGAIGWFDFALLYTCKIIIATNKVELTMKLTNKELVLAKTLFFKDPHKTIDNDRNILITRDHLRNVSHDLIELLKDKYGNDFIENILSHDQDYAEPPNQTVMINWEEFLREIAVLILLNRANNKKMASLEPRVVIPPHLIDVPVVPPADIPSLEMKMFNRQTSRGSKTPATPFLPNIFYDKSFLKHSKILDKLKQREQDEECKRKYTGSLVDCSIVESLNEEEDINLPRLKPYARDDRNAVTDPWTAVKDIQRLRHQLVFMKTIH